MSVIKNEEDLTMKSLSEQTISLIVDKNFKAAAIFRKHNIDFRTRGNLTFKKACTLDGVCNVSLEKEIYNVVLNKEIETNFNDLRLENLVDYIETRKHQFFYTQIPIIISFLTQLSDKYSDKEVSILNARMLFLDFSKNLTNQIMIEEKDLFPTIRNMGIALNNNKKYNNNLGFVKPIIQNLKQQKEKNTNLLNDAIDLFNRFSPAEEDLNIYNEILATLNKMADCLNFYNYLKESFLFKKAIELEEAVV